MLTIEQQLLDSANSILNNAYAPYSNFKVSAALLGADGKIYNGINIENASYPCGMCAEASAIAKMVSNGVTSIKRLLVVAGSTQSLCAPCGMCRQRIREFASGDLVIHLANTNEILKTVTLEDLLYLSFGPENLKNK